MTSVNKPVAKNVFFSREPLLIIVNKTEFCKEVRLDALRPTAKSKTELFDKMLDAMIELAKQEYPCSIITKGDVTYALP